MKLNVTNLSKIAYSIIILGAILTLMYLGSSILIPLAFAWFLSLLLLPACDFFERFLPRVISIIITFILVSGVIAGISYFFGSQFAGLFNNILDFKGQVEQLIQRITQYINSNITGDVINLENMVTNEKNRLIFSADVLKSTINTSTDLIISLILTSVYTFLFLLYRKSFKNFILYHFKSKGKEKISLIIENIKKVIQNYFYGLAIIIVILGALNGLGLFIIGLEYAFLFGFFAALLAIVPYIGTFIGGLLPFLYALVNFDELWKPIAIVLWYTLIQTIEGNILTPKIVGSKVSLNPLIALLSLIVGGKLWGIAGMILFIPFMATLKVIFDNFDNLKPYGILMSSKFGKSQLQPFKNLARKLRIKNENDET